MQAGYKYCVSVMCESDVWYSKLLQILCLQFTGLYLCCYIDINISVGNVCISNSLSGFIFVTAFPFAFNTLW